MRRQEISTFDTGIAEGTVCGIKATRQGMTADRSLIEMSLLWRLGDARKPD
jgi:hypothetical protein